MGRSQEEIGLAFSMGFFWLLGKLIPVDTAPRLMLYCIQVKCGEKEQ